MIHRARTHLVAEGWLEKAPGPVWKITDSGRLAAEKPASKTAVTRANEGSQTIMREKM
jgi:hypothetical protein